MPPSSHHPPALNYWEEQMQMDPEAQYPEYTAMLLGACCKLKLGSSWGLTFSLVQTTSASHRAWQKVKEPVAAIVDSSEAEESHPTPLSPAQGRAVPHKCPHMPMYLPAQHVIKHVQLEEPLTHTCSTGKAHSYCCAVSCVCSFTNP